MKTLDELLSLDGRVVGITGGGGHLGSTFAETMLELGARVALIDSDDDRCRRQAVLLEEKFHSEVLPIMADLEIEHEARDAVGTLLRHFGKIDVLINNAAFVGTRELEGWIGPFESQSAETWRRAIEVNLTAPFLITQTALPALRESGRGSVINIGSHLGVSGPDMSLYAGTTMGTPAAYGASKGGLIQFSRWLATVVAPRVRVNSITPGGIARGQPGEFVVRYRQRTPLRRMATEEDFKGVVAFLASDASAYLTGQNIVVDGGWTAW